MSLNLVNTFVSDEERERPREKVRQYGVGILDDSELLSVILGTGYKGLDVEQLSKYLLSEFGTRGLFQFQNLEDFQANTGLPFVKSCQLLAMGEYFRRLQRQNDATLKSSEEFYEYIRDDFKKSSFEKLYITCLDPQRRVLYSGLVAQGASNKLSVSLAEVFHHPVRLNTRHFYLAHNHPRGGLKPSEDDMTFTLQLKGEALRFGLRLDDHLIVGENGYYSFALKGFL